MVTTPPAKQGIRGGWRTDTCENGSGVQTPTAYAGWLGATRPGGHGSRSPDSFVGPFADLANTVTNGNLRVGDSVRKVGRGEENLAYLMTPVRAVDKPSPTGDSLDSIGVQCCRKMVDTDLGRASLRSLMGMLGLVGIHRNSLREFIRVLIRTVPARGPRRCSP